MFKNYLLTAFRNLRKHKAHSIINIAGLSLGMTCFILIFLFIRYETGFDSLHEKGDRIYRVFLETRHTGEPFYMAPTMLPLAPALADGFPEIEYAVRVSKRSSFLVGTVDQPYYENLYFADPEIFHVFSFQFIAGNPESALNQPNSVVITRSTAEKYFGSREALGGVLKIDGSREFTVTGVLEELPENSHFEFRLLLPISALKAYAESQWDSWSRFSNDYTYILTRADTDPSELEIRFPEFLKNHMTVNKDDPYILHLQKLRDIHFSNLNYDFAWTYPKNYLTAFTAIGFFILFIACANFMNLATARSSGRSREVGLRKVVGATRNQLIHQFITESILLSFFGMAAAVGMVFLILPRFRIFLRREIAFNLTGDPVPWIMLTALALFTGLLAGSYPAFMLSAYQPIKSLKKSVVRGIRRFSFRTVFVVMQFAVSITLIIVTLMVYRQLHYMKTKDMGYRSDQILVISLPNSTVGNNPEPFRLEIAGIPGVEGASLASGTPASGSSKAGDYQIETPDGMKEIYFKIIYTDYNFIKTFDLTVLEGREFSREYSTDSGSAVLVNETAAKKISTDSVLGMLIKTGDDDPSRIIGVIKDFHYDSAQHQIDPMVIQINPDGYEYIAVRLQPIRLDQILKQLETSWKRFAPEYPFEHFFISQGFERYYRLEQRLGEMFQVFAFLAIFISCLGVLGLISFTAGQSRKEIGIRKVMGASTGGIVIMLSRQFVKWILIANIIAWPLAWFIMNKWLQNFAYRAHLGVEIFILSGFAAMAVAMATAAHQTIKAARSNPADSLRCE